MDSLPALSPLTPSSLSYTALGKRAAWGGACTASLPSDFLLQKKRRKRKQRGLGRQGKGRKEKGILGLGEESGRGGDFMAGVAMLPDSFRPLTACSGDLQ